MFRISQKGDLSVSIQDSQAQNPAEIVLKDVEVERSPTHSRVSILVQGQPIWFESTDAVLEPAIEAFASVLLLPALHQRLQIKITVPVDLQWWEGIQKLSQIYARWWGYSSECPIQATLAASESHPRPITGACFTGGVDSFFTFTTHQNDIQRLVFAHGYDIGLNEHEKMETFRRSLEGIAHETHTSPIVVRTNLRQHPLIKSVEWDYLHGSALAVLAILLSGELGRLIIPPSYAMYRLRPWGSHPETDPLFSTNRCQVLHDETTEGRFGRLQAIAANPLAQKYLRVCNKQGICSQNCSACEKCVMTMVALSQFGQLAQFQTFDHSIPLSDRVNHLGRVSVHLLELWQDLLEIEESPQLCHAIRRQMKLAAFNQAKHNVKQFLKKTILNPVHYQSIMSQLWLM